MSRWLLTPMLMALSAFTAAAQQQGAPLPPDEDAPAPAKTTPKPPAAQAQPQQSAPLPPDESAPAPKSADAQHPGKAPAADDSNLPPDEDASAAAANEKVAFNPVQSKKFVSVGDFYFKKGDYKAATQRYRDATRYNDSNSEAWLKLGEAAEKRDSPQEARAAYERYLQLTPKAKNAAEVRKRLEKLK